MHEGPAENRPSWAPSINIIIIIIIVTLNYLTVVNCRPFASKANF